ncbi:hypothetical protein F5I97DRAFT_1811970 [Phlebopus sp. FC_14]|nr:hypothetical protein F5I97DRAFT_1811970 [Phlebopus sp. FC_14]
MSLLDVETSQPISPERRLHELPEIIDVDSFDPPLMGPPPRQRRRVAEDGRSVPVNREIINISDSDDDLEIMFVGHNPARPRPIRTGPRERIFSPPPVPQIGHIPPVPPIPQRFLPMRRQPPPFPTADGLIIPNDQPLPFEVALERPRPAENPPPRTPPPAAAPPSRHVPTMGFGGALLAGVRNVMHGSGNHHGERPARHRSWGLPASVIMRWDPFDIFAVEDEALPGYELFYDNADAPDGPHRIRRELVHAFERRAGQRPSEPDYKPVYTHPDKPSPGFTYDFAPSPLSSSPPPIIVVDDSPGVGKVSSTSSRSGESSLACAHCHDPLVLGALDIAEGRDQRRLWGLRCGHLVDGKCIDKLMKPSTPVSGSSQSHAHMDAKGKGKMTTEIPDTLPSTGQGYTSDYSNSMRSRLRPRRLMPGSFPAVPHSPSSARPISRHHDHHGGPVARSHRSKGKGKGKAKAPVVEAEYEWTCPVGGCGRLHHSLFVNGRWTMDEKRGAIAVFV